MELSAFGLLEIVVEQDNTDLRDRTLVGLGTLCTAGFSDLPARFAGLSSEADAKYNRLAQAAEGWGGRPGHVAGRANGVKANAVLDVGRKRTLK